MLHPIEFISSRSGQRFINIALALTWILFAYRHIEAFNVNKNFFVLVFVFSETLQIVAFMLRDTAVDISRRASAWAFGILGTFTPLLFIPTELSDSSISSILIILGISLQILGLSSLNTSFGIIAAKRKVKTNGMYRFVRHPMYASYLFLFLGYLLANLDLYNFAVWWFAHVFMIMRIKEEELILRKDHEYLEYTKKVKWRLIPGIY